MDDASDLAELLACPCDHKSPLVAQDGAFYCADPACAHAAGGKPFSRVNGIPVLISFDHCDTICNEARYQALETSFYVPRRQQNMASRLKKLLAGDSDVTLSNCARFLTEVRQNSARPKILVIGSGTKGQGTNALWESSDIIRTGIDIYPSDTTDYIADAHYLPFRNESFDGVWIQAVLEHVADPNAVAEEIHRVLKPDGLVYAETPFMQQVHEGAYDFQRFSVSGHRYLFRRFEQIAIGGNKGPGTVLAWAIRYFIWGLFRSRKVAVLLSYPFLMILRLADRFTDKRALWDGPSGVFFLGRKSNVTIRQESLPGLYRGFQ